MKSSVLPQLFSDLDRDVRIIPRQEIVTPHLLPVQVWKREGWDFTAKHNVITCVVWHVSGTLKDTWSCSKKERSIPRFKSRTLKVVPYQENYAHALKSKELSCFQEWQHMKEKSAVTGVAGSFPSEPQGCVSAAGSLSQLANIWVSPPIWTTHKSLILAHTCRLWFSPVFSFWYFPLAHQALSTATVELLSPVQVTQLPLNVSTLLTAPTVVLHPACGAIFRHQRAEVMVTLLAALTLFPQPEPPTVLGWQPERRVEPYDQTHTDKQAELSHAAVLLRHTKSEANPEVTTYRHAADPKWNCEIVTTWSEFIR